MSEARTIDVYVANGAMVVPLTIRVCVPVPEIDFDDPDPGRSWFNEAREQYSRQAKAMVEAMFSSMPGGLVDALLVELLDHKRSILRVPHEAGK